jgi:hypothetical protein
MNTELDQLIELIEQRIQNNEQHDPTTDEGISKIVEEEMYKAYKKYNLEFGKSLPNIFQSRLILEEHYRNCRARGVDMGEDRKGEGTFITTNTGLVLPVDKGNGAVETTEK